MIRTTKLTNITTLPPVEVYKKILNGEINYFPIHYFNKNKEEGLLKFKEICRWLVLEHLNISPSDIYKTSIYNLLFKHKLSSITYLYREFNIDIKEFCFKEELLLYNRNKITTEHVLNSCGRLSSLVNPVKMYLYVIENNIRFPSGYWKTQNAKDKFSQIIRYILENKLNIPYEKAPFAINENFIRENHLVFAKKILFNKSLGNIKKYVYPDIDINIIKPKEIAEKDKTPRNKYISKRTNLLREQLINKFEVELKLTPDNLIEVISYKFLKENDLEYVYKIFHSKIYDIVDFVYPNKYKKWQVSKIKWTDKALKEAVKWLIFEKLKISINDVPRLLKPHHFKSNGMGNLLIGRFNNKVFNIMNYVYKNKNYKPWHFKENMPKRYWNDTNSKIALKWLIEDVLKLDSSNVFDNLKANDFFENYLGGLYAYYNNSLNKAILSIYPNLIIKTKRKSKYPKIHCRRQTVKHKMTLNEASELIKNMIINDLNISKEEIIKKVTKNTFVENGMYDILDKFFGGNVAVALYVTFPDILK